MAKRKQDGSVLSKSHESSPLPNVNVSTGRGPRKVLPDFNSLDQLVDLLRTCKRVVVVTGAGISVSCGIPDFRSENGVYDLASRLDLGLTCAEDLFDLEFFVHDPGPFFKFAKVLYPGNYTPSPTHRFIKALEIRGKLLRNFTQNIDGLEAQVGLKKYVACHGSFLTASCLKCKKKRAAEDIRDEVMQQKVPRCPSCQGVMKPNITFFGEKLPNSVKRAVEADHKKADLFLVFGTSLKVQPVSRILQFLPPHVPQVLVNRELVRPPPKISDGFDLHLLGDCDDITQYLCGRLGWDLPPPFPSSEGPPLRPPPPAAIGALPPATGGSSTAGVKEGVDGDSSDVPPPRPLPTFSPPNSFRFLPSKVGMEEGSSAWAALSDLSGKCGQGNGDDSGDFDEVVTCDVCDKVVEGDIYACQQCFGYDLCEHCNGGGSNDHARETGHSFRRSDAKG